MNDENISLTHCRICGVKHQGYKVHTEYFKLFEPEIFKNELEGINRGYVCNSCIIKITNTKTLYHVSNVCDEIPLFTARVPENRHKVEDNKTDRVSASKTIEGCFTAVPWKERLEEMLFDDFSLLFRVYEFDVTEELISSIISSEYLYTNDLVRDSQITKECWITKDIAPSRSYLIELQSYEESYPDEISYVGYAKGFNVETNGTNFDWESVIEGHITAIEDIQFEIVPEKDRLLIIEFDDLLIVDADADDIYYSLVEDLHFEHLELDIRQKGDNVIINGILDLWNEGCEISVKNKESYIKDVLFLGEEIKLSA